MINVLKGIIKKFKLNMMMEKKKKNKIKRKIKKDPRKT